MRLPIKTIAVVFVFLFSCICCKNTTTLPRKYISFKDVILSVYIPKRFNFSKIDTDYKGGQRIFIHKYIYSDSNIKLNIVLYSNNKLSDSDLFYDLIEDSVIHYHMINIKSYSGEIVTINNRKYKKSNSIDINNNSFNEIGTIYKKKWIEIVIGNSMYQKGDYGYAQMVDSIFNSIVIKDK